jgi:hypothetical protein
MRYLAHTSLQHYEKMRTPFFPKLTHKGGCSYLACTELYCLGFCYSQARHTNHSSHLRVNLARKRKPVERRSCLSTQVVQSVNEYCARHKDPHSFPTHLGLVKFEEIWKVYSAHSNGKEALILHPFWEIQSWRIRNCKNRSTFANFEGAIWASFVVGKPQTALFL